MLAYLPGTQARFPEALAHYRRANLLAAVPTHYGEAITAAVFHYDLAV